uniref:Thioredoxin n=1 Tax=Parascaris univalens TaxID=6257 RepID=A0A914ZSY6_PARUN
LAADRYFWSSFRFQPTFDCRDPRIETPRWSSLHPKQRFLIRPFRDFLLQNAESRGVNETFTF